MTPRHTSQRAPLSPSLSMMSRSSFEMPASEDAEEDELWVLDSFLTEQNEEMRRLWSSLDSTRDGKIDKVRLENDKELAALGLKHLDLSSLLIGMNANADSFGYELFRDAVRVQLAFEKLSAFTIEKETSVTALDYRRSSTNAPVPDLYWSGDRKRKEKEEKAKKKKVVWIGDRRDATEESDSIDDGASDDDDDDDDEKEKDDPSALWKAFMLQPRLNSAPVSSSLSLLSSGSNEPLTRWVNVEGLDPLLLRQLAVRYQLDPLAIEDALKKEQRPKVTNWFANTSSLHLTPPDLRLYRFIPHANQVEEYDHGLFIVVPMLAVRKGSSTKASGPRKKGNSKERRRRQRMMQYHGSMMYSRWQTMLSSENIVAVDNRNRKEDDADDDDDDDDDDDELLSTFWVETESVSIFVIDEERTVVTVQEKKGDCW